MKMIEIDLNSRSMGTVKIDGADLASSMTAIAFRAEVGKPPVVKIEHLAEVHAFGRKGIVVHQIVIDGHTWEGDTLRELLTRVLNSLPDDDD